MAKINDIKAERDAALEHARSINDTGTQAELREASARVEKAQKDLIAIIIEGAKPCPRCGAKPTGVEQPTGRGGSEYEIGCPTCTYVKFEDGSLHMALVRGGMIPRHAVEVWNEGMDVWARVPPNKEIDALRIIAQEESAAKLAVDAKEAARMAADAKAAAGEVS